MKRQTTIVLYSWGDGREGKLGHGKDTRDVLEPKRVSDIDAESITGLSCGSSTSCFVAAGRLFAFGSDSAGKPWSEGGGGGVGTPSVVYVGEVPVYDVACGQSHSLALDDSGRVFSFGQGEDGELGLGDTKAHLRPTLVSSLGQIRIKQIACGWGHSMALDNNGSVYTWGWGNSGRLGHGEQASLTLPRKVESLSKRTVTDISSGWGHCACVDSTGSIYTWGRGINGQLGHGVASSVSIPTQIAYFLDLDIKVKSVSCGGVHTLCQAVGGQLYSFGDGTYGQLGHKDHLNKQKPTMVEELVGRIISSFSAGGHHSGVVTRDGDVFVWGRGTSGQLGLGTTCDSSRPTLVQSLEESYVASIACGYSHTVVSVRENVRQTRPQTNGHDKAVGSTQTETSTNNPLGLRRASNDDLRRAEEIIAMQKQAKAKAWEETPRSELEGGPNGEKADGSKEKDGHEEFERQGAFAIPKAYLTVQPLWGSSSDLISGEGVFSPTQEKQPSPRSPPAMNESSKDDLAPPTNLDVLVDQGIEHNSELDFKARLSELMVRSPASPTRRLKQSLKQRHGSSHSVASVDVGHSSHAELDGEIRRTPVNAYTPTFNGSRTHSPSPGPRGDRSLMYETSARGFPSVRFIKDSSPERFTTESPRLATKVSTQPRPSPGLPTTPLSVSALRTDVTPSRTATTPGDIFSRFSETMGRPVPSASKRSSGAVRVEGALDEWAKSYHAVHQQTVDYLNKEIARLRAQNDDLTRENHGLKAENRDLKNEVKDLREGDFYSRLR